MRYLVGLLLLAWVVPAAAHDVGMASLRIRELHPDHYEVVWHLEQPQDRVTPHLPPECEAEVLAADTLWHLHCPNGLATRTIGFHRPGGKGVDIWFSIEWLDGSTSARMLRRSDPVVVPHPAQPISAGTTVARYGGLGLTHILTGWDHLLFLGVLMLSVSRLRMLLAGITAFTGGHSVTLIWAALRGSPLPAPPLEACIAASVVVIAAAALRGPPASSSSALRLAGVTFAFGLLHGLGFASALAEVGLPPTQRIVPLLSFNAGVEAGQLLILLPLWPLLELARRRLPHGMLAAGRHVALYGAGALGWFWMLQRMYEGFT